MEKYLWSYMPQMTDTAHARCMPGTQGYKTHAPYMQLIWLRIGTGGGHL